MIYNKYDIVKVPFPFTDKNSSKKRPALVISSEKYQSNFKHLILCMITTAKHSDWLYDIIIQELAMSVLSVPSKIRLKIFSLEESLIINRLGTLGDNDIQLVSTRLKEYL